MFGQLPLQISWAAFAAFFSFSTLATAPVAQGNATWPYQTYKSVNFTPPQLDISTSSSHVTYQDGTYLFIATDGTSADETAPLIMDFKSNNSLVWQGPVSHAFNFGVYTYQGKQVLAYWNGTVFQEPLGRGNGEIIILDNTYEKVAVVTLGGIFQENEPGATYPSNIDAHEIYITKDNTLLVTANNVTQTDLSSVGGPADGWVVDCLFYEIDIASNEVLFSWSSLEHLDKLPLSLSVYPLGSEGNSGVNQSVAWGYFHINAVSSFEEGYLVSSRYFCSAMAIAKDGSVNWRLQGRNGGDFTLGNGTNFCYQHDIRAEVPSHAGADASQIVLHMFDTANAPIDNGTASSALALNVDLESLQVSLIHRYQNISDPIFVPAMGSYQPLPNGDVFAGFGFIPVSEQFSNSGETELTVQYGPRSPVGTLSYRSFRQPWIGCPKTKPSVVAQTTSSGTEVYVSWNGATEVVAWDIYGGTAPGQLMHLASVSKIGFETAAVVKNVKYVQVRAALMTWRRVSLNLNSVEADGCACSSQDATSEVVVVN